MELRQHDCLALPPGHWLLILEDLLVVQRRVNSGQRRLASALLAVPLFGLTACPSNPSDPPPIEYQCGTTDPPASVPAGEACGAGDPNLPPEPALPTDVCQELAANKSFPDENNLDTSRVQTALAACKGRAVKLVADGDNNVFITSTIAVNSVTLWVDSGVTLYASRNPELYQKTGNCGTVGVNDSGACNDFITMSGSSPGIVGDGTIDGQGGEPLVGRDYSWWQSSYALRAIDGSIGNPTLINTSSGTTGLLLYRIHLQNSPKFHVKITSTPSYGTTTCTNPGDGFIVWGITLLTPSRWTNSRGEVLTPSFARNTDGVDPGANSIAQCGVIACNTISTGDDHVAIKGGHWVSNLVIAHNHFGTGHGMSIGSETYGSYQSPDGVQHLGVENVNIYDLTIDADSRPVGSDAQAADFNGIRVKSDESRGGTVNNITYSDICMRDLTNAILISTAYNPLFAGTYVPKFGILSFHNIHHVTCMALNPAVMTLNGFSAAYPAGPITLDNVIVDNMGPMDVSSQFANIVLGPGNFGPDETLLYTPVGQDVAVLDNRQDGSVPRACVFPTLPAPAPPSGWLR
jgi:polygalacturonase